jgi:hypothetical protein
VSPRCVMVKEEMSAPSGYRTQVVQPVPILFTSGNYGSYKSRSSLHACWRCHKARNTLRKPLQFMGCHVNHLPYREHIGIGGRVRLSHHSNIWNELMADEFGKWLLIFSLIHSSCYLLFKILRMKDNYFLGCNVL